MKKNKIKCHLIITFSTTFPKKISFCCHLAFPQDDIQKFPHILFTSLILWWDMKTTINDFNHLKLFYDSKIEQISSVSLD